MVTRSWRVLALAVASVAALVGASCSSSPEPLDVQGDIEDFFDEVDPERSDEARAALDEVLTGPSTDSLASSDAYCVLYASLKPEWVDGGFVPLGTWIERASAMKDVVPAAVEGDLASLANYGDRRWRWNLGDLEDRPTWNEGLEQAERNLAEWAVANCELPEVLGFPEPSWPAWLEDETPSTVRNWCSDDRARLDEAQEAYRELTGSYAPHGLLLETHTGTYYVHSGAHILVSASASGYEVEPDPDSPCA